MKTTCTLRQIFLLLCLFVSMGAARAQTIQLTDVNWGNWLNANGYDQALLGDSINGWSLNVSDPLVTTAIMIDCSYSYIYALDGIEYFTSLEELNCSWNHLTTFPNIPSATTYVDCSKNQIHHISFLPATLTSLDCSNNPLDGLPSLPSALYQLNCYSDSLTSLPSLPNTMIGLYAGYNFLTSIPGLPSSLSDLDVGYNNISALPILTGHMRQLICDHNIITNLPSLGTTMTILRCGSNNISILPPLPSSLVQLDCSFNPITTIPSLPLALQTLNCSFDLLSSLPALPAQLYDLHCGNNALTSLPVLSSNLSLLYCENNRLSELPVLPPTITGLRCSSNPKLSCIPRIYKDSLSILWIGSTNITCLPNKFTANNFDINPSTLPLCTPASGCEFYYNIAGNIHYDTATTCSNDSLHPGAPITNMKVQMKQGGNVIQQFYTFNSGGYSFKTPSLSNYTVDIDTTALPLSVVCPGSFSRSVSLSAIDSVKKFENFGMQCRGIDFGVQDMYEFRFRPTFRTTVHINAGNIALIRYNANCGAGTAGTVTTTYTNAMTYIGPAPGALTPSSVSGNTVTYNLADLNVLIAGSLDIILETNANAVPGSSVCITTTVTSTAADIIPANNTLTQCFPILNSWDPNHKDVSPIDAFQNNEWLTYTIHFQNTGSDTAYLVVLRDTLSQYLNASSFQYLASSHHAVIQLDRNAMAFTFPHINLVDSATNPPLSEGWIQYRVRANDNLPLGTQVHNTAYIYFDLNPAVVTNTTTNTVTAAVACSDTTIHVSLAICGGDTFSFYGQYLTLGGIYSDTLTSAGGCDSIISLTLAVRGPQNHNIADTICEGSNYIFYGSPLSTAGTYADTLQNIYGCDSVVTLFLAVRPAPVVSLDWDTLISRGDLRRGTTGEPPVWCFSPTEIALAGGSPASGHYTGMGVSHDTVYLSRAFASSRVDTIYYTYTDIHGCSATAQNYITDNCIIAPGVLETGTLHPISLYPNPNTGSFILETSSSINSTYTITDMLGAKVAQDVITSDTQSIDAHNIAPGVYTIYVSGSRPVRFTVVR